MKVKFVINSALLFCLSLIFSPRLYGEVAKGDFGVGLNYPGIGVRYFLSDKISLEGKGQIEKNIGVYGLRGYYYFKPEKKLLLLTGLEADFVTFKGDESKGTGIAGELFVGAEYFFTKSFSFQMDLGPAFVLLKDKNSSESVNGLEYIVNSGINYYFGKKE